jgi:hypothetical protein
LLETQSFLEQDVAEITPQWEVHFAHLNISFVLSRTNDCEITTSTSRTRPRKIIIHPKIRRQAVSAFFTSYMGYSPTGGNLADSTRKRKEFMFLMTSW